jgi:PAS domain S-box-containing protein
MSVRESHPTAEGPAPPSDVDIAAVLPGMFYVYDLVNDRLVYFNRAERSPESSLGDLNADGRTLRERILHPDDASGVEGYLRVLADLADGQTAEREYRAWVNGEWRWYLGRDSVYRRDAAGRVNQVLGVAVDITARKRAERALEESELRLRMALLAADGGAFVSELATGSVWWSAENYALWEVDPGQTMTLDHVFSLVHLEDRPGLQARMQESMRLGLDCTYEFRLASSRHGEKWLSAWGRFEFDASGNALRMSGINRDVTSYKQDQRRLKESEIRFRDTFDTASVGIAHVTADGRWLLVNDRLCEIVGYPREELLALSIDAITHPDDRARPQELPAMVDGTVPVVRRDLRCIRRDGRMVWLTATVGASRGVCGNVQYGVAVIEDITARKQLEQELREQDQRKDRFLATLAHELRNPLAPLRYGLRLLDHPDADPAARQEALGMMDRQLTQLGRLVEDLLDVSRITRDRVELRRSRVSLDSVLRASVESCHPLLEERGHRLSVDLASGSVVLDADPVRMAQVFSNLLHNAAKYTDPGGTIAVTARRVGGQVEVSVRDNGIGIPPDQLDPLFDMFMQLPDSQGRALGGLGVGLTLVRWLVELHGGTVVARSDGPGRGAEFVVTLPLTDAEPLVAPARPATAAGGGRVVLVVDDNVDTARSLALMLELDGHRAAVAHDGLQALAVAERVRPDVVLLDLGLPKLEGLGVARRLRESPWGRDLLLVAVTGWGQAHDRQRTAAAGFDHHLVKPIDLDLLGSLLQPR